MKKVIAVGASNGKRGFNIPAGISLESITAPPVDQYEKADKPTFEYYTTTLGKDFRKALRSWYAMWYAHEYFPTSVYANIRIPVLIVLGDRDEISIEHGKEMYTGIKHGQLCVLPNTSHEVFKEQPALINEVTIGFLEKKRP